MIVISYMYMAATYACGCEGGGAVGVEGEERVVVTTQESERHSDEGSF